MFVLSPFALPRSVLSARHSLLPSVQAPSGSQSQADERSEDEGRGHLNGKLHSSTGIIPAAGFDGELSRTEGSLPEDNQDNK